MVEDSKKETETIELARLMSLALDGGRLTDQQADALEKQVSKDPSDLNTRVRLIGFYMMRRFKSAEFIEPRCRHISWIVENDPSNPIAGQPYLFVDPEIDGSTEYDKVKRQWLKHVNSTQVEVSVLRNAAHFFSSHDYKLAEQCLLAARLLDVDREEVEQELAFLYRLWDDERPGEASPPTNKP